MTDRFEDLGIAPELVAGVESVGWDLPGGLQRDAIPVVRRGNNVVLHASAGSGAVGAYGLGILDRLRTGDTGPGTPAPRALVLVSDADTASLTADSLARLAGPAGVTVRTRGPGWATRPVDVLVLSATAAAAAVRDSTLKLEGVVALVVDGADHLEDTGQWEELELMIDVVPPAAQRVVVTGRLGGRIDGFLERHVRKAMTIPPRSATGEDAPTGGPVRYSVTSEHGKAAVLAALVATAEATEVAVVCRTPDRAEAMERALQARGVTGTGDEDTPAPRVLVLPHGEADQRSTRAEVVSADVPFDEDTLTELHAGGGAVLVTPREREHLLRIARRAGLALESLPDPEPVAKNPAEAIRDRIRGLLGQAELSADLALIEPLLDEFPAAEVAAAALWLAREGLQAAPATGSTTTAGSTDTPRRTAPERPTAGAPRPKSAPTWIHLFVSVGSRDEVNPGDIVGAMTGEAGINGEQVGKVDIRESHTTVAVATEVADKVIQALNGRTLKGRSLRVDYDRKTRSPKRSGSGGRPGGGSTRGGRPPGGPNASRGGSGGGASRGGSPRGGTRGGGTRGGGTRGGGPRGDRS